jgi:hypothetical protein
VKPTEAGTITMMSAAAYRAHLEHFQAKWIRFAVETAVKIKRELIPPKWHSSGKRTTAA